VRCVGRLNMGEDKALSSNELLQPVEDAAWRNLVESGNRRAQALGLTEDDVPRLVTEARRERHAR
jgi:hypothetical protein